MFVPLVFSLPLLEAVRRGLFLRGDRVQSASVAAGPAPAAATPWPPLIGPPLPPPCPLKPAGPDPRVVSAGDFKPPDAVTEVHLKNGGTAFQLHDGGWMYRYPKVAIRQAGNKTRLDFAEPPYTVEYSPETTVFHDTAGTITQGIAGDVTYHQASGTIHQDPTSVIYHYCDPNVVIHHTSSGVIYHDESGVSFHGQSGVTHVAKDGTVSYQGEGGVTRQEADGTVTHWTEFGVIKNQPNGNLWFTPKGQKVPKLLKSSWMNSTVTMDSKIAGTQTF